MSQERRPGWPRGKRRNELLPGVLEKLRETARRVSRRQLARILGCATTGVSAWIRGKRHPEFRFQQKILELTEETMSSALNQSKPTTPAIKSAISTAAAVSRHLRAKGMFMSGSQRGLVSEGVYAVRVGDSNKVAVGYHVPKGKLAPEGTQLAAANAMRRVRKILREKGYVLDENDYIHCEAP